jgi:hypothetical protein
VSKTQPRESVTSTVYWELYPRTLVVKVRERGGREKEGEGKWKGGTGKGNGEEVREILSPNLFRKVGAYALTIVANEN